MDSVFWIAFEQAHIFLEPLLILLLLNRKMGRYWQDKHYDTVFLAIVFFLSYRAVDADLAYYHEEFLLLFGYALYILLEKSGPPARRALWMLIGCAVIWGSYLCVHILILPFPGLYEAAFFSNSPQRLIVYSLQMLIEVAGILFLTQQQGRDGRAFWLMRSFGLAMSLLLIFIASFVLKQAASLFADPLSLQFISLVSFSFAMVSILILLLYDRITAHSIQMLDLQEQLKRSAEELKNLENLLQNHQSMRVLRHEMKNNLLVLRTYAENSDYQKLRGHLDQFLFDLSYAQSVLATGHPLVDALITARAQQIRDLHAELQISIVMPEELSISDSDLCSILGNMLDNAIDAIKKLPSRLRFVYVFTRQYNSIWQIEVVNSYDGHYRMVDDRLQTTKEDRSAHGIGLMLIDQLAERYGGYSIIHVDGHRFNIAVYIPVDEKESPM